MKSEGPLQELGVFNTSRRAVVKKLDLTLEILVYSDQTLQIVKHDLNDAS